MNNRQAMRSKVHIARKEMSLTDESYRDLLRSETGKESSKHCSERDLDQVLRRFKALGWKPKRRKKKLEAAPSRRPADTPQAYKMRALWSSLFLMGEVESREPPALAAYVRRMTDRDDPQWITAEQGNVVIEGLKDWCKRAGFVPTSEWHQKVSQWRVNGGLPKATFGHSARILLVQVLWDKLIATGCMKHGMHAGLDTWLMNRGLPRSTHLLAVEQADAANEALGAWLRKEVRKAAENAEA